MEASLLTRQIFLYNLRPVGGYGMTLATIMVRGILVLTGEKINTI